MLCSPPKHCYLVPIKSVLKVKDIFTLWKTVSLFFFLFFAQSIFFQIENIITPSAESLRKCCSQRLFKHNKSGKMSRNDLINLEMATKGRGYYSLHRTLSQALHWNSFQGHDQWPTNTNYLWRCQGCITWKNFILYFKAWRMLGLHYGTSFWTGQYEQQILCLIMCVEESILEESTLSILTFHSVQPSVHLFSTNVLRIPNEIEQQNKKEQDI